MGNITNVELLVNSTILGVLEPGVVDGEELHRFSQG